VPTIVGYRDITKGQDHWLRSPKQKELFGPLGATNIRTFVDPQNPKRVAVVIDVPDIDALNANRAHSGPAEAMARHAESGDHVFNRSPQSGRAVLSSRNDAVAIDVIAVEARRAVAPFAARDDAIVVVVQKTEIGPPASRITGRSVSPPTSGAC
jgi:hypothetical protein